VSKDSLIEGNIRGLQGGQVSWPLTGLFVVGLLVFASVLVFERWRQARLKHRDVQLVEGATPRQIEATEETSFRAALME